MPVQASKDKFEFLQKYEKFLSLHRNRLAISEQIDELVLELQQHAEYDVSLSVAERADVDAKKNEFKKSE